MEFDFLNNLATGFAAAGTFKNLGLALLGCLLGTLIGVLPGIGPIPTIAILLPITFQLDPLGSLVMLAGIYYGAQYGGSTTSILVNMPGEASSIVTCIDGYQMARQGRAGAALGVAALGSFFAGCVGTVFIALFGPPLSALAQQFNSPDYFSLMVLGLVTAVVLAHGSVIKAIGVVMVGLLLGLVGTDVNSGVTRYTFGVSDLWDGVDFLPLVIGSILVFGLLIDRFGLAISAVALTLVAAYARRNVNLKETFALGAGLAIFTIVVFVYALGQPLPAWWGR